MFTSLAVSRTTPVVLVVDDDAVRRALTRLIPFRRLSRRMLRLSARVPRIRVFRTGLRLSCT
jgi:hypothetical protein